MIPDTHRCKCCGDIDIEHPIYGLCTKCRQDIMANEFDDSIESDEDEDKLEIE